MAERLPDEHFPTARRLLIDLALARSRPGAGSSDAFMHRRTALQTFPDLRNVLQGIDWLAVGAVAARAYMPERATQDLDILIRAADEPRVAARLEAAGATWPNWKPTSSACPMTASASARPWPTWR